jgi:V8-like Glu-specific endopeptidase
MRRLVVASLAALSALATTGVYAQVVQKGPVTIYTPPAQSSASAKIDYANAKPMPLPQAVAAPTATAIAPSVAFGGSSGSSPGGVGTGQMSPVTLVPAKTQAALEAEGGSVAPQEYGTYNHVYTTARVNGYSSQTSSYYPYRAAGKLYFQINGASYVCSASMIKPGIAVTAGHCVANYGTGKFYSNWQFVPAYANGSAPYGVHNTGSALILSSYLNGTDGCAVYGVVCPDDVALLYFPDLVGNTVGWFGYGYGGYSYNSSSQVLISQLGYPQALDSGVFMQRNDSQGYVSSSYSNNTIIGSLMTGGSSGGPWVVNLGRDPILSGTSFGYAASHNVVVGVTSWGYTSTSPKEQGAAPFTSGNIQVLVSYACTHSPGLC